MNNTALVFFGIFLISMLFVPPSMPFMVPEAEALTEAECLSSTYVAINQQEHYTVVTCENPFDVTVYPGQRLHVQRSDGLSSNSLPFLAVTGHGETGALGTYQYTSNDGIITGIVRIIGIDTNPLQNISVYATNSTFTDSQWTFNGRVQNYNSYTITNPYIFWWVTDDAGNKKGYGYTSVNGSIAPGDSLEFSTTKSGDSGMTTVTPYVIQAFRGDDGTPVTDFVGGQMETMVYADGLSGDTTPPVITFLGFDDGMVHTRMATNSTGYNFLWYTYVTESNGANPSACHTTESSFTADTYYGPSMAQSIYNHLFPIGTTTVTCAATDYAGNTGTGTFVVIVTPPADTTPPTLILPSGGTYPASPGQFSNSTGTYPGYRYDFSVTATDDDPLSQAQPECQGHDAWGTYAGGGQVSDYDLPGSHSNVWSSDQDLRFFYFAGHAYFPVGTHYVTCTATDNAGNTESGTFVITVPGAGTDTTPPTIIFGLNSSQYPNPSWNNPSFEDGMVHTRTALNSTGYNFLWYTSTTLYPALSQIASNTSSCQAGSETITGTQDHYPNSDTGQNVMYNHLFPVGTTTVTCAATDYAGNTGTGTFVVIVTPPADTTPPDPGAPYTITDDATGGDCQYIGTWNSGSKTCTLTTSISSTSSGIIIGSDGITIDGTTNIAQIAGAYSSASDTDYGVDARNSNNFTIKNLNIQGFAVGIMSRHSNENNCDSCSSTIIDNEIRLNNNAGIFSGWDVRLKIISNFINANGGNGITLRDTGHPAGSGCNSFVVKQNNITSNAGNGIDASNTSGICFEQNTSNDNLKGFYLFASNTNHIFQTNIANSNTNSGFDFSGSTDFVFTGDNTASGNGDDYVCSGSYCDNFSVFESADTTPPTMTFQGFDDGMVHTRIATNSTGFNFYFHATATEYQESNPLYCQAGSETITPLGNYPAYPFRNYNYLFPVGTTTVTCTGTDSSGNIGTASFTITVNLPDATVTNAPGSSTPGCEETDSCFLPQIVTIDIGDTVGWSNTDNAAHTVTSGSPTDGPSGVFDSSLIMAGGNFFHTFDQAGSYSYHCMVHPWMLGTVVVNLAETTAAEEEIVIPEWVKFNAGWWDDGLIDDRNYVTGLQWLITNGIMTIPSTEQGTGSDDVVPSWVKNNARWWADGSIDDRNYVTGLQWLITNGVMIIG